VDLWANATLGLGPYTYTWTGLPTGCSTANSSEIVCVPSGSGTFSSITVAVRGTDGYNVTNTAFSIVVDAAGTVAGSLTFGGLGGTVTSQFWGIDISSTQLNTSNWNAVAADVNATPLKVIRYGTNADGENVTNTTISPLGCSYNDAGVCGASVNNYTLFKAFCGWLHCTPIVTLPAEPNDPGLVAQTVSHIENVTHFDPIFNIGNEPSGWNHFNIAYKNWKVTDNVQPTAAQFATLVVNDTKAILSVDPNAKIVGITQGSGGGAHPVFAASIFGTIAASEGKNLTGLDFHAYPSSGEKAFKVPSVALSTVNDQGAARNFTAYRTPMLASECATCSLTLSLGEYNTGANRNPFPQAFASGIGAGATAAQLMTLGASTFSYFDFYGHSGLDLINSSTTSPSRTRSQRSFGSRRSNSVQSGSRVSSSSRL